MTILSRLARPAAVVAAAALLLGGLSACAPAADTSATVTIAYDSDLAPQGYDPLRYSTSQAIFFSGLYQSLAERQEDGSVAPGLATEFAYNDDNTELTLTLAADVVFSDGSTLTAELVKANLDRRSDPELVAYAPFAEGEGAEIVAVDVVDETHVTLTFATAQEGFETNLAGVAGMIVGQAGIDDPASLATTPNGSGAFVLSDQTVKGSSYVLTKKEEHPNLDAYGFDTYIFKPIEDVQARTNAVISGQADTGFISTSTAALAEEKGLELSQIGGTIYSLLVFDRSGATNPAFADPNVRIALGLAIDRQAIVDGVHPGDIPAVNALPAGSPGFSEELDAEYSYDPERAKELLAAAGYPDLTFDVVSLGDSTDLEALQASFAEVGVTMNIIAASSTEELFAAVNTQPVGPIELGWGNPVGVMFGVILGFANPHSDASPALAGLTGAIAGAQTDEERAGALLALNEALVTTGSYIPVYEKLSTWAFNGEKVAPIVFPGGDSTPLLTSIKPAE